MPRKHTNTHTPRQRKVRMWPVKWRGKITRDVGTDFFWADSADQARKLFQEQYPMHEVMGVGKPPTIKPVQ